jgi:hypothetical protein
MFKGQTYGEATKQREAVRAVPTQAPPTEPAPPKRPRVTPGGLTELTAPTERPEEPITAGAPFGAGPGPEAAPMNLIPPPGSGGDLALRVRAIATQFPNPALLALLAELESQ